MALLTANLRSESERCWTHGAHGLDSVAYRFRPNQPAFVDELLRHPHRESGGKILLDDSAGIGVRVAVLGSVVRVEGRLDPLLTGYPEACELRPPADAEPGERAARRLVERYAGTRLTGDSEVARLDLAHELSFDDPADGLAFLATAAAMLPPRRKTDAYRASDGTVETVYFRTPKGAVRERFYDKGVESGSDPPGLRVRIEAQRRFPKNQAMTAATVPALDLPRLYGATMERYAVAETVSVGRDQAVSQLLGRVARDELSMVKARGLLGDLAILAEFGRAPYADSTGRRRLAELRKQGITPEAIVPPERVIPVGRLLRESVDAWAGGA
ncbi:hypothetical protein [Conexibacter sp. DBS9H8]|uniref:hypothetical protein n=1 Tax=Conexibacter sp. DBS9H8 TaxID=2937801 RepID=UPI00200F14B8|nr:hypothetical protein [Conexibacter sp. DBS9H8]